MAGGKVQLGRAAGGRVQRCGGREEVRWGEWMWICGERVEGVEEWWERLEREVVLELLVLWGGFFGGAGKKRHIWMMGEGVLMVLCGVVWLELLLDGVVRSVAGVVLLYGIVRFGGC